MSVTPPRRAHTVSLIPEIWLHIFDLATHVPGNLEAQDVSADLMHPKYVQSQRRLWRHSLITACHLVRVCRIWKILASRFLYRSIVINRGRNLQPLCRSLVESRREAHEIMDGKFQPLGWWTTRLDIDLHDNFHDRVYIGSPELLEVLAEVIDCLPNVTIFIFSTRRQIDLRSSRVMAALCTHGPTLQVLALSTLEPYADDFRRLLTESPNLRGLHLGLGRFPHLPDGEITVTSGITALGLAVGDFRKFPGDTNHFPNLREVVYHCYPFNQPGWHSFLNIYGGNLTKITIRLFDAFDQNDADLISSSCPNLQNLSLSLYSWETLLAKLTLPPVQDLWLRFGTRYASKKQYNHIYNGICDMTPSSVRTIRLTDPQNVDDLRLRHKDALYSLIWKLSSRGCTLEDDEGCSMTNCNMWLVAPLSIARR
jgi:hypothetical protein